MARILVMDDDKNVRNMARLTLVKAGHDVEVAEDGAAGLEKFGDGIAWDLTLVDQRMPGLTGHAVLREARQRDPAARIILITAFDTIQLASDALWAGATDFLRKPFSTDMLRGAVSVALARPRQAVVNETAPPDSHAPAVAPSRAYDTRRIAAPLPAARPSASHFLNGFFYWPTDLPPGETPVPPGIEVRRAFQVKGPSGEMQQTIVGVTPHIREQVRLGTNRDYAPEDSLWDVVCQGAVINYLWEKAEMPPPFLPLYELTSDQMQDINRRTGSQPYPVF